MINERVQQVSDLRVGTTSELVAGKPAGDPGYEVGDLHARFPTGVDEPNVGQLASRPTGGVDGCDIGNAFRRQRGLFVVYDGERLGVGAPVVHSVVQCREQRFHQRSQFGVLQVQGPWASATGRVDRSRPITSLTSAAALSTAILSTAA